MAAIQVFLSYSRKDAEFKDQLDTHLSQLKREKKLVTWHDRLIEPGKEFEAEILEKLASADIILFLLSANFTASDFCQKELDIALKRHNNKSARVIPIRVSPMDEGWKKTEFGNLNALPGGSQTISEYENRDIAYAEIATKVRQVVESLLGGKDSNSGISSPSKSNEKYITEKPVKLIKKFFGREEDLKQLKAELVKKDMLMVLNGIGGIGKSELVKEFLRRNEEDYDHIAWINMLGSLKTSLNNDLRHLYPRIQDRDDLYKTLIDHLANLGAKKNLLVLDNLCQNLMEEHLDLVRINWIVIMTSRIEIADVPSYELKFLDPDSAQRLFYSFYSKASDDKSVTKILDLAGYHTLSIELLAKTANENRRNLQDFAKLLEKRGFDLGDAIKTKVSYWKDEKKFDGMVSEHLEKLYDMFDLQPDEIHLLKQYAVLPPIPIAFDDLCQWLNIDSEDDKDLFWFLHIALQKKGLLKEENESDEKVEQNEERMFSLHRVLRWLVQRKLKPKYEDVETLRNYFLNKVNAKSEESSEANSFLHSISDALQKKGKQLIDNDNTYMSIFKEKEK